MYMQIFYSLDIGQCSGRVDQWYPHPDICSKYFHCHNQKKDSESDCGSQVFDVMSQQCVPTESLPCADVYTTTTSGNTYYVATCHFPQCVCS